MEKQQYVFAVYDDSYFVWALKMIVSAVLTPLWLILVGLGIDFNLN